ncbi:heavy metal translocating P-type ATPase [Chitinimonas arctica]|uniref:P-type Zn(2+) transporter n=1 Tax=Chitinimonas arctica TaxID=2594795 RepID=A0A516SKX4_9NEIS|nr:heavy metal translocating P-type ATPase [Chitinimonas arctica]QDQ28805.1 heavy metal translocating P-type ATPase [Chitinimonas arctica]
MSACCPDKPQCPSSPEAAKEQGKIRYRPLRHAHAPSAPAPAEQLGLALEAGYTGSRLHIAQLDCPTEEALIRKKLAAMKSVQSMRFDLLKGELSVVHAEGALPRVVAAITELGMTAREITGQTPAAERASTQVPHRPWRLLALSGGLALASEIAHWAGFSPWLVAPLALAAVLGSGLGTYRKGWIALKHRDLNINALMTIAVTGAMLIGQWPEAAMVMVLFSIAEMIEARSLDRARHAIDGLLQLAPQQATVRQADGEWLEVAADKVKVGERIRVKPGERIALDGTVVAGGSAVDQAAITGESVPVDKAEGDPVFAGSINTTGSFEYQVVAEAGKSALARIIHAVEQARGARAPTQRFVERFARIYTPLVFAAALALALLPPLLLGGDWHDWIYKALVLLVIACPCALVISTPVTVVSGLAAAAKHGILVKGGVYLEEGRKLKWLALDKTGTLTHGKPALSQVLPLDPQREDEAMQRACSLAARSDHPVSQALARAGQARGIPLLAVTDFTALPGRGVQGSLEGETWWLGNHRLIEEKGVCSPSLEQQLAALEQAGQTVIALGDGKAVLALFALADAIKDSSRAAIQALHELGIKTVMLSGDNPHTVSAIAAQAGIDQAHGDLLPDDKRAAIDRFAQLGMVGMVGDGINDAPALARADIGFAMGAAGSDSAIETADVALMDDDLRKIARFVRLSQTTHRRLLQNIALALGIKAVFLVLTLLGMGSMWMAVFADMGASLLVVGNGLRLLRS